MALRMIKNVIIICVIALSTTAYAFNPTPDQWAVLKKGEIIKWLEKVKGTEVKKGVAVGIVNAPSRDVWAVIHDNNNFIHFMPRLLESILVDPDAIDQAKALKFDYTTGDPKELVQFLKKHQVDKMTDTTAYFFSLLSVPWPATNRWYIIKLEDFVTSGRWYQHWTYVMGNLKTNDGSWELIPLDNDRTLVTYTVFSDPGGMIPDWIINAGTNQTLPDVIRAVRKRVKQESHAQE